MRILGIDPGLATVGYGVIEYSAPRFKTLAYGAVTTPAHTRVEDRLDSIFKDGMCVMAIMPKQRHSRLTETQMNVLSSIARKMMNIICLKDGMRLSRIGTISIAS